MVGSLEPKPKPAGQSVSLQLCSPLTRFPSYISRHRVPFSSLPTARRVIPTLFHMGMKFHNFCTKMIQYNADAISTAISKNTFAALNGCYHLRRRRESKRQLARNRKRRTEGTKWKCDIFRLSTNIKRKRR
jgi:hypothetical protein